MPKSLLEELRSLAKKNHFLDVSEEIRTIIREKTRTYKEPYSQEVKKIITDIRGEITTQEQGKKKQLIDSLHKLLEELE
jgi:metal-responsive CopG/Arc/MetJ family transcriptional regulator